MTSILLVDDDAPLLNALRIGLEAHGYALTTANDGAAAIALVTESPPDVVLLDLGLPRFSGLEVIQAVRAWSTVPIIVLSARHQGPSKVAALDAGADDYVTKPFGMDELLARIRAVLRRTGDGLEDPLVEAGDLRIDLAAHRVERAGELVHLTKKEWAALALLAKNPGSLITQDELLREVWGPGYEGVSEYLRTLFARLRRKLEVDPSAPRHLLTEPGVGYRFER
jgi:two-component system, OmpR family, KDP operon response regulator KdpE